MKDKRDVATLDMFDAKAGQALKERGMRQAVDAEREQWKAQYEALAHAWFAGLSPGTEFQGEDLRGYVQPRIGPPHHPGVWGALFRDQIRTWFAQHRLSILPRLAPAKATRSRGHVYRLYRKVR